ncbi:MAG: hypothetical protein ACTSP9_15135 [Promethearchaeota archaeon]
MAYDITAYDENGKKIVHLRFGIGTFRKICEQGYDWFKLINAWECDGGVSGMGVEKQIKLVKLLKAMKKLKTHDTKGRLAQYSPLLGNFIYDTWGSKKRILRKFMRKCINWCILNKRSEILIGFY